MALIWIEELDRAAELCERAIAAARARGSVAGFVVNVGARAAVLDRRGALADAEADLREATNLALQYGIRQWLFVCFMYGRNALMERPQLADIAALIEQLELPAELEPTLTGVVVTAARGSFAILRGAVEEGIGALRQAQATRLLERARSELAATGARPRRFVLSGAESLTPSERRVAELAAGGRSNPQIAQDLFVTVNTVETHLRHAYRKLDIRSRDQLAVALTRPRGESQPAALAGEKITVPPGRGTEQLASP
jgi:DNA-binding CsgD family transcriptional regulator